MTRLLTGLVCASLWAGSPVVSVDEAATRILLQDQRTTVQLAVENADAASVQAKIHLQWLYPSGAVASDTVRVARLSPGRSVLTIPIEVESDLGSIWLRLRYRIEAGGGECTGVFAVAAKAAHFFELHMTAPVMAQAGETVSIPVHASHPVTRQPVAGVRVVGKDDSGNVSEGLTGPGGIATLRFRLPETAEDDEVEIRVEGTLGDFSQEVEASFPVSNQPRIILTTDKPLYQPGQTMHLRALVFHPNGRAMSGAGVSLRVVDPDDIKVFAASMETSRFGVAAADWTIPDNLRLGDYIVTLHSESFSGEPRQQVKISRYDLPEFTVSAKPDRPYYLYGQDAVIEVKAEYLFGQPVPRGQVRLVRESSRRWDWRSQKWDIDEAETYEAVADKAGRSLLHVKLAAARKRAEPWDRYLDLAFTAYYRDPSTGRTEQRRFDVRLSRDPIHIYQANGYVFTSYADGAPAACIVTPTGAGSVKTNRYGVARLPEALADGDITLLADDGRGAKGRWDERYFQRDGKDVRIRTDRTLYRPGESVHVEIETDEDLSALAWTIRTTAALIDTRWLVLQGGHAAFDIPWRPEFRQEVFLIASWDADFAARTILFPAGDNLHVDIKPAAAVYKPGEEASATIQVDFGGRPVESVLGIAVVDRAVMQRADSGSPTVAGISREDLNKLDVAQPFAEGLDLLAEALLAGERWGARTETSEAYFGGMMPAFQGGFDKQFRPVSRVLDARYRKDYAYPRDRESLREFLSADGLDLDLLRDPWGMPFEVRHKIYGPIEDLEFASAGPDKQFGTADDLSAWRVRRFHFQASYDLVNKVLNAARDFPTTEDSARAALRAAGIDADHLPDPWGHMYRVRARISGKRSVISFESAGPDGVFGTGDDFAVGQVSGSYFARTEQLLGLRLAEAKIFPRTTREWRAFLRKAKLDPRDPWGGRLDPVFSAKTANSDLRQLYTAAHYPGPAASKTETVAVTLHSLSITLRSNHGDGFDLATFSRNYRVEDIKEGKEWHPRARSDPGGTITGRVTDPTAGVSCAAVTALRGQSGYSTRCDAEGSFRLSGLEPGLYEVRVESPGFQVHVTSNAPAALRRTTVLDVVLRLGSVSEAVVVEAAPVMLSASNAQVARVADVPRSTPRLREYFPETLLWQPSLETGADGRAQLKFKLADNITTWQVNVIGSTIDGDVGSASAEIRAFQPFFISHDPPRILTQGDRIEMPVTVRNYLDQTQNVAVSLQPEDWFELAGPARTDARVASGGSANAIFPLRVKAAAANGKPRVTAAGAAAGDAIEKPVTVHPDGQEISIAANGVLREEGRLSFEVPANAIANSQRAELKIYPNLLSHLVESIEGILERPHGCAEQTISSTYPNVMLLRYLERAGRTSHPLTQQARRNVRAGVDRLLGYITESGALAYWVRGEANLALTAYGIQFLTDAAVVTPIDEQIIEQMRDALWKMQSAAGSWDTNLGTTAYVTQALADRSGPAGLRRALDFLQAAATHSDDPYLIAVHALAAHKARDEAARDASLNRLRSLAHSEAGLSYWTLKTSTPFYGWSLAGQLETTATAVQALSAAANPADSELIAQAMLFLLRNRDRHGVWHSTQATVRVLNAILDATGKEAPATATTAEVIVNGRPAITLAMPPSGDVTGPIRTDISKFLVSGANRVEVRRSGGGASQMQIAGAYYVPWQKDSPAQDVKLSVQFDRTVVAIGSPVTCRVHAERITSSGGMLLAEIGLPPGADVDRHSLQSAGIDHYDILPDRVVMYLWPRAGCADFSFRFRPRFGMLAKTAPSLLYDYYNPGARSVVAPVVFTVSGSKSSMASGADSRPSTKSASASRSAGRAVSPRRNSRTNGSKAVR